MFDLVNLEQKNFVSAHLAEGPGSFIQATMFYRDKFTTKNLSKTDKYYAVTLHSEKQHVQPVEDSFINYYSQEKPVRFIMHQTYPRDVARLSKKKDNGDIISNKTRELFRQNFNDQKADFITADGGFDWENENVQEQESYKLILAQIIMALKIQKQDGSFVCKLYETFTKVGSKFLSILQSFYNEVYIVKPLMSRASNSEKYAVCIGFKYNTSKELDNLIAKLEVIIDNSNEDNKFLIDIFPDYKDDVLSKAIKITSNTKIANNQFIDINEMSAFIDKQNYRGDEYQARREMQIDASQYWIDTFFPDNKDFDSKKNQLTEFVEKILDDNEMEIVKFIEKTRL